MSLADFLFPVALAGPTRSKSRPTKRYPLSLLSITRRQPGPTCRPTTLPYPHLSFPRLGFAPHWATRAAAARAGWDGLPAWPARTSRDRRARAHMSRTRPRRDFPHLPPRRAPLQLGLHGGGQCHLGRPDGQSRGRLGLSHRRSRRRASKSRRGRDPGAQATNPFGVFDSFFPYLRAERGGRRAGGAEHGPGAKSWTRGRLSPWTSTSPARPSSPSRQRLHHRPIMSTTAAALFSPLGHLPVMLRRCRDASPCYSCLDAGLRATELPCPDGQELLSCWCS
jgi:hypothetical protein